MSKQGHQRDRREQFVAPPEASRGGISPTAFIIAAALVLVAAVVFVTRSPGAGALATELPTIPTGQDVAIALADLNDGQARFYRYGTAAGREVRFFVMKSSDGVIRAAFDACDVCYRERRGYQQQGDVMLCRNCGRTFRSVDINVLQGGCNPAPLERTVVGDQIVLKAASIEAGVSYF